MAVGLATVTMQLADAVHPPAGGTALLAVLGSAQVHDLGYVFVVGPLAAAGVVLLVSLGLGRATGRTDRFTAYR